MNLRDELTEIISDYFGVDSMYYGIESVHFADHLINNGVTIIQNPRPLEEWGEDYGDVLWWKFPIEEPPYVGSPLSADWPGYHTHWLPIPVPKTPKEFIDD